jgi:hypothetical protein
MGRSAKLAIGLLSVLLMGWIYHGPLGRGQALVDMLEVQGRAAVAGTNLKGITLRMHRAPLARVALLDGPADALQREGLGSQPGVSDDVRAVPGMGSVRWRDESDYGASVMPLLAETELLVLIAYLIGLGLGGLLFGRRKRQSFLD